jgi:uncharacterized metal-binding protein YceD (DUF177 family)
MDKTPIVWSVPVAVEEIPETGLHLEIEPPEGTRAALAKIAGLRALPQLSASFDLTRQGAGVHVSGQVNARVGQICVVTLEPIESTLAESIDLKFMPSAGEMAGVKGSHKLVQSDDELSEALVGGSVDLGALATEFLILSIDPYPRKADAQFAPPQAEDAGERPFAVLEALKKRLGRGES